MNSTRMRRFIHAISLAAAASLNTVPATSPLVQWTGRILAPPGDAVFFDWEGVTATVAVVNFTSLTVSLNDNCNGTTVGGGSRWAVRMTLADASAAAAQHRIATFYSGPAVSTYYMFNNPGGECDPRCNLMGTAVFSLIRLTESRLSGCGLTGNLSVTAFTSDGVFVAPPPPPPRRMEFIGDSITAGDLNSGDGLSACGNAVFNDDILESLGGQLCADTAQGGLDAQCMYTAWGGIRLGTNASWGMVDLYPYTFSASGTNAYGAWNFSAFQPDAVVINLGTNDRPPAPAWNWISQYVQFATGIVQERYAGHNVTLFLGYGPMTIEYEPFVMNATAQLNAAGLRAYTLNFTLPHPMTGCYGHPSAADNTEILANVKPVIQAIMGW